MPPTDGECLAFRNEQHAKGIKGLRGRVKAIHEKWPTKADHMAYYDWSSRRADNEMAREMVPVPREDLVTMITTMNYNRDTDRGRLVNALERVIVPWIPVGSHRNGEIYRIAPGALGLQADDNDPKTDRELVPDNVLGVNTNVQPTVPYRSRKANFSEVSTKSNESDDSEIGGFVFHQIGALEFWGGKVGNFRSYKDAARGPWLPTRFCVVIRFGKSGTANGVYLIYDFYPRDESGERDLRMDSDDWGQLPGDRSSQQFSVAKIADEITELRFGRTFELRDVLDYPVELVRTVKTPQDAIIRATIA
jgi:hypothetical protein